MRVALFFTTAGVVLLGGFIAVLRAILTAPFGYQDERGFHLGEQGGGMNDEYAPENPS